MHLNLGLHKSLTKCDDNLKKNSKMMLENECFVHVFWNVFLKKSIPLFDSCSNYGMEIWIAWGRRSQAHLMWAYNGSGLELFTPITPNKNGWPSCKNLDTMVGATSPQFPNMTYFIEAITSIETKPIPLLKMGRKACQQTSEASKHSTRPGPKSFPNTWTKVESKEANWCWKFEYEGKEWKS